MSAAPLAHSARTALLLGGGFTLARDVAQFGVMLLLVRLLTPADYGSAALAQSVIGLISVLSFATFAAHSLQLRDPADIDWQAHFSMAVLLNTSLFLVTLLVAWLLSATQRYAAAALPLAVLSTTFLVEIPGTLRLRMLESNHEWVRFRLLLITGTVLGLGVGLVCALAGAGVWALVVQPPLFGLPAAIDLFWRNHWRADWGWSWARYRDTARFGFNRMGAAAAIRGRQAVEQTVLAGAYDLASLGIFTRTLGLATLAAGRIGSVAMQALYPVLTRAEIRSARFQRMTGLVLQSVCWTTIPAAVFFAMHAGATVSLLYGQQWLLVVPLLPIAMLGVACNGIAATLSSLLLANNQLRLCLVADVAAALIAVALAIWLLPAGLVVYLAALAGLGFTLLLILLGLLVKTEGIASESVAASFVPPVLASSLAALLVEIAGYLAPGGWPPVLQLLSGSMVFAAVYLLALRFCCAGPMRALLEVAPGGRRLLRWSGFDHHDRT